MNSSRAQPSAPARKASPPCRPYRRAGLLASALAITGALLTAHPGCSVAPTVHKPERDIHAPEDVAVTTQQARIRMRALAEPLSGAIIQSADQIAAETTDRAVKREALLWKIQAVPALREALFRPHPFVALMDTWVLTWQMSDYFDSERGQRAFGASAPIAARTCRQLESEMNTIAASLVKSGNVTDARAFAQRWAREHPIEYSISGRESTLSRVTERELPEEFTVQEVAGDTLVSLDDLSRRVSVYSVQLFDQARWQAELVAMNVGSEYQAEKALPLAESAVDAAQEAVAILTRLEPDIHDTLLVAKTAPETISRERVAALEQVSREREAVLERIGKEREAVLAHISKEREVVLAQISRERETVMAEMRQSIASERTAVLGAAEDLGLRLIDHALVRIAVITVAVLISIFFGMVALLFITRRIFTARG